QITITHEVVNYPGVKSTSGEQLTEDMRAQAESFGAEFLLSEVERLELDGPVKKVHTSAGTFQCFGVLLATGAHPRMVGFNGEESYKGRGVAYCATCDGEFFTGREVFVVGGGFAAAEEAMFLTKYARQVTILIRKDDFSCAKSVADAAKNHPKIRVLTNTVVEEVGGDHILRFIRYRNTLTGEVTEYRDPSGDNIGVFVFAGYAPATDLVKGIADLNDQGYILTDRSLKTSVDGLYAAGDVCVKALRQVVTAVGDGALAATELEKYAAAMQKETGLVPAKPEVAASAGSESSASHSASSGNPTSGNPTSGSNSALFTPDMLAQLNAVFARMANPLILKLYLDNSDASRELEGYMTELSALTDKISLTKASAEEAADKEAPSVFIHHADGSWSGLAFHGVPGGHEFTSFVLGLYNVSGPGQPLEDDLRNKIGQINSKLDIKVLVSLSCTMCPELVVASQRIAAENPNVTTEVYDVLKFPQYREKFNVMSVPCLVLNDGSAVSFGKKNLKQLLNFIADHS
ncbi:MAG: FAD-dependent oxidoreductase, partial [Agathobacter sp.]|nr:FAD-dependent oxidoreductase [Agathobacter sp.]